ncbi:MAG TPA: aminodeoxychorismate/anthranilate synthase component II [Gemmatimonadales bacterium]|jgi:anthranilate synthase/aminodeoxychorismate synthase-like glutamine amidotransferase|nr:aminodeoxychorismate/anthranilate synthase component II [Gemmatimonadales bacterium]
MLFVLDNYDSFTYNLVQYLGELGGDGGAQPVVYRNDAITVDQVLALKPAAVILSPGPKTPREAGILVPLVRALAGKVPVLGVCLGHQAIGEAFGGKVVRASRLMHGKTCPVVHDRDELFDGIPSPFTAMRYHSLVVEPASLPESLVITAMSADRPVGGAAGEAGGAGGAGGPDQVEIMAMKHRAYPIYGVQFHPESIGTEHGKRLLENFLKVVQAVV